MASERFEGHWKANTRDQSKAGDVTSLRRYYNMDPHEIAFKVLRSDGRTSIAYTMGMDSRGRLVQVFKKVWNLPTPIGLGCYIVGKAQYHIEELRECRSGWHFCYGVNLLSWWSRGEQVVYIVEPRGWVVNSYDKSLAQSARLIVPVLPARPQTWHRSTSWSRRMNLLRRAVDRQATREQRIELWNKYIDRYEAREV